MSSNLVHSDSNVAVSIRDLSKSYFISHNAAQPTTMGEAMLQRFKNPLQRAEKETFWALKDVNYDVQRGDVVGIVGRNGAGKSTLLKILSNITEPTTGQVDLYGRVGSLLEVGTGFHPELTGRENIYLNGAILGMRKREIERQFDSIVDFSEVEQFLDTPVKRYSSGMYVRLAFAVAAHLSLEIMIVDEVLAVGDAEFQKKCLGKMKDVSSSGRTVLFVSHNMQAVSVLCNKGVLMAGGRLAYAGDAQGAIDLYLQSFISDNPDAQEPDKRRGTGDYRIVSFQPVKRSFEGGEEKEFEFEIARRKGNPGKIFLCALVYDSSGAIVMQCDSRLTDDGFEASNSLRGAFRFATPWLKPGDYHVNVVVIASAGHIVVDDFQGACAFSISPVLPYRNSVDPAATKYGQVFADFEWQVAADVSAPAIEMQSVAPALEGVRS